MDYWDERYQSGRDSGKGSVGDMGRWKHQIFNQFGVSNGSVLDYGCGDLSFWGTGFLRKVKLPGQYMGIDKSKVIIDKNIRKYPTVPFFTTEQLSLGTHADTVLCLDVLFHQIKEEDFIEIIQNICILAHKQIFLTNWIKSPFPDKDTDGVYQKYRNLDGYERQFNNCEFVRKDCWVYKDNLNALYRYIPLP